MRIHTRSRRAVTEAVCKATVVKLLVSASGAAAKSHESATFLQPQLLLLPLLGAEVLFVSHHAVSIGAVAISCQLLVADYCIDAPVAGMAWARPLQARATLGSGKG